MSETNAPKLRSELAPETCWDLTQIYKTDADWEEAFRTLDDLLAAHQACRGHLADSAEMLKQGLETGDALGLRLETPRAFPMNRRCPPFGGISGSFSVF